jgi:hypothetical protein
MLLPLLLGRSGRFDWNIIAQEVIGRHAEEVVKLEHEFE